MFLKLSSKLHEAQQVANKFTMKIISNVVKHNF